MLIIVLIGCYQVVFGKAEMIRKNVASVSELQSSSRKLNTQLTRLEKTSEDEFNELKNQLAQTIEEYRTTKQEYEQVVAELSAQAAEELIQIQENDLKDIYDTSFLWTIAGNYASQNGIDIDLDFIKNTTSASALNNTSSNYIVCDLNFVITGTYVNLIEFIQDLEEDDRLNFEINDFDMQRSGSELQVTLTVRKIKINADDLIESSANNQVLNEVDKATEEVTQKVDALTSSTKEPDVN